jgi:hypothetical protein
VLHFASVVGRAHAERDPLKVEPEEGKQGASRLLDGRHRTGSAPPSRAFEARDLNEAIQVASKHPAARLNEHLGWGVEVRPIETCRVEAMVTDTAPSTRSPSSGTPRTP